VQTSLPGEVNLVNTTGLTVNFWDGGLVANKNNGLLDGGSGTWNSGSGANDNWTNATGIVNAPWTNGAFALFEAVPGGTVTVDNSLGQVTASGLNVATNGYLITGGALTLVETVAGSGATEIRVGDGTAAGAGITATIGSVLQGSTQLVKLDLGTLVLTGVNTYTGGTAINEGVLQVANDNNLGAALGGLSFNGGTLATTASFASARMVTLNANGGTFDVAPATTLFLNGTISGAGGLTKADTGTLTLTGTNTYGGGTTITAGTLQLGNGGTSGSIVGDVADNGTLAFDRSDTVAFSGVISGMGAVAQIGSGTTIMTANNPYTGGTTVSAGTLVVGDPAGSSAALSGGGPITVASGATLGGYGSVTGSVTNSGTVAAGNGTPGFGTAPAGTFTIIGNLLNQGTVNLASDPIVGNVLEVQGNYVGSGGRMNVNTVLGSDNSPSDKLVISGGTATGDTSVHVTNAGGAGTETLSNGIPIVQAINGATTVPGAFTLAGEVRAGDVTYDLFRGGVGGSDPNDWFLRSSFEVLPPGVPPGLLPILAQLPPGELSLLAQLPPGELSQLAALPPGVVPPGLPPGVAPLLAELPPGALSLLAELPPGELSQLAALPEISATRFPTDPPSATLPPGIYPIVGPELATDGVVQPIARQLGLTMLGTLHERIGDTLTVENAGPDAEGWGRSGWVRFFGQQIDNRYEAFADPSANGRLFGVQAGFDILRASFIPGHRDAAGLYFAYGNSAMDVNGLVTNAAATGYVLTRTGTVNLYGYSGGAYWTHYGPTGWYVDAVLQGTIYNGNATTQFANLPTNGSGIITSLEIGYPIPLSLGPRFILEPQGQILWQHTSFRQAYDGLGEVGLGSTSGATGRLGLRAQSTIVTQNGQVWQPYVRANLWQNWGGAATTTFGVDQVPLLQQSTQLEFAAGLTFKYSPLLSSALRIFGPRIRASGGSKRCLQQR
jgi:outer membrane autotransporter protein